MAPTNDDIRRLHDKIEALAGRNREKIEECKEEFHMLISSVNGNLASLSTSTAIMAEKFNHLSKELRQIPPHPDRPCTFFVDHIKEHRETQTLFKKPIVSGAIGGIFVVLGVFLKSIWAWIAKTL